MTDDEIEDEIADLSAELSKASGRVSAMRREIRRLRAIKADRGNAERLVNDHALLRFMQRHKGIDVDAFRAELRRIAGESEPFGDGEHHRHPSGVVMVLGDEGQVITVLSPEQSAKWAGR